MEYEMQINARTDASDKILMGNGISSIANWRSESEQSNQNSEFLPLYYNKKRPNYHNLKVLSVSAEFLFHQLNGIKDFKSLIQNIICKGSKTTFYQDQVSK